MQDFNDDDYLSPLDAKLTPGSVIDPWADKSLLMRSKQPPLPREPYRVATYRRPDPERYAADRQAATGPEFTTLCYAHGVTLFDTVRGCCLSCEAGVGLSGLPARKVAELVGADHYDGDCPTHGPGLHHTGSGRCTSCSTARRGRPAGSQARADARRNGEVSYLAVCEVHGETAHHVGQGKCLTCYTSAGRPRVRS